MTHGAVSAQPCTAQPRQPGLQWPLVFLPHLCVTQTGPCLQALTSPPSSRQKPEVPTQKLCLCFCSLGIRHGHALCAMVALLPSCVKISEQAGLLQPWAASPWASYNFPAPTACVRRVLSARFWWDVWQGRVTQQLFWVQRRCFCCTFSLCKQSVGSVDSAVLWAVLLIGRQQESDSWDSASSSVQATQWLEEQALDCTEAVGLTAEWYRLTVTKLGWLRSRLKSSELLLGVPQLSVTCGHQQIEFCSIQSCRTLLGFNSYGRKQHPVLTEQGIYCPPVRLRNFSVHVTAVSELFPVLTTSWCCCPFGWP